MPQTLSRIVYLEPPNFTGGLKSLAVNYMRRAKLPLDKITFSHLTAGCLTKRTKTKWTWDESQRENFETRLAAHKPELIIINCKAALGFITNKYVSLALCRGGIYYWRGIPCIVIDETRKAKSMNHGGWVLLNDMHKIGRWINGTQRREPKFEYTVCRRQDDVSLFAKRATAGIAIAADIETTGTTISCIGYTVWQADNEVHTWVIPFVDTTAANGCYWQTAEEEVAVWELLRSVHESPVVKCFQNGIYDSAYMLKYQAPLTNYIADTLHLFHCIWTEAPKRLDFISSIAMDYYRYWKDEGKEDAKDDDNKARIPFTKEGLENYWLYNALDCYNTMMNLRFLCAVVTKPKMQWALDNYREEFKLQSGPFLRMSMRGIKCNTGIQSKFNIQWLNEATEARGDLLTMVDDPDFNPNAPLQVASLVYDVLRAKSVTKGNKARTTDEPTLKLLQTQSVLLDIIIEQVWKTKKPANNASKYGAMQLLNDRYMYQISAAGTGTGRANTKGMQFWIGKNVQNLPKLARVMLEADPGYVLFDIDYAQSDAYFTAFESQDEKYMATMIGDKDSHCVHAEHFFKIAYDKLIEGHAVEADWVDHPTKGVRQITKRVVYGANYMMYAKTLFMTMGKKSVIAAGAALGYDDIRSWSDAKLIKLCDMFLKSYFQLYQGIPLWLADEVQRVIARGNLATCCFGRTRLFFGNLRDAKVERELAAYYGQGGTAGNINHSINSIYYGENSLEKQGVQMLFQVHDSLIGQVPNTKLHLIDAVMQTMENTCHLHGRDFVVPVDAKVGLGWGKRLMNWQSGKTTLAAIQAHDRKWWSKFNANAN